MTSLFIHCAESFLAYLSLVPRCRWIGEECNLENSVIQHWVFVDFFYQDEGIENYFSSDILSQDEEENDADGKFSQTIHHPYHIQWYNGELRGSVEGGRMYLFPSDFSSCSESTEIWHADSFCVKEMSLCFFLPQAGQWGFKLARESQPPPNLLPPHPPLPPSNDVKHTHAQCFSSQGSKSYSVWRRTQGERGEGGVDLRTIWSIFFSAFIQKRRDIFDTKRVGMPNFSGFGATWKTATK